MTVGLIRALQRLVALALLIGVVSLLWRFGIAPMLDRAAAARQAVADNQIVLERLNAALSGRRDLAGDIEQLIARVEANDLYVAEATPSLAEATLQERLTDIVDGQGAQLRSVQGLAVDVADEAAFAKVGVRASLTGGYDQVIGVLHAIEATRPALFIEDVTLKIEASATARGVGDARDLYSVVIETVAYLRPDAAEQRNE